MTKDWVNGVGHSPVCHILLQIVVRAVITSSPSAWTSSAGMLSTPADFPFFNDCTAASNSLRRMGWSSSVSVWGQFSIDGSPLALWSYGSEQYCNPSVQYPSFFCEAFSWMIQDSSSFPLFHSGQVFHELVCSLTVALPQIFFNVTTLFSYPVFFCRVQAPLDVFVHFLVFISQVLQIRIFSFSVLSFCRTYQEILQCPRVLFFWRCLPRISLAVWVTAVLKVVIIESMSISSLYIMVRGANFPPIIAWKVSNTLGSFSVVNRCGNTLTSAKPEPSL